MRLDCIDKVSEINKGLASVYGNYTGTEKPLYRLSYVGDCIEKRKGDFDVYLDGTDTFLRREENVIREVKKYAYADDDSFIVERLLPNPHKDVFGEEWSYEGFYTFPKGLLPPLKAVVFLINAQILFGGNAPRTEKEAIQRDKARMEIEKIKTREILDTQFDYTDISMRLKHGAATTDFNQKVKIGE